MSRLLARAVVLAIISAATALFAGAGPVAAHAERTGSTPAQGSTIGAMPHSVKLKFSEVVGRPAAVTVVGPDGSDLATGDPEVVDRTLTQPVDASSASAGQYSISYQVISADGHPVSGTVGFVLRGAARHESSPTSAWEPSPGQGVSTGVVVGLLAGLELPSASWSSASPVWSGVSGVTDLRISRQSVRATTLITLGVAAASLLTLVLVLLLGGAAPTRAPPGLPQASTTVRWGLVVAPLLSDALGALTVGFALLSGGYTDRSRTVPGAVGHTRALAAAWAGSGLLTIALTAVQMHALAPTGDLLEELSGSVQVRGVAATAILAAYVTLLAGQVSRSALPLALVALVPEMLTGHVRTDSSPLLAGAGLVIHVAVASLWLGGLAALGWLVLRHRAAWSDALVGYSRMALLCVLALAVSGTVVALARVHSLADLFGSAYGLVIVVKALVLVTLAAIEALQRRHVVGRGIHGVRDFLLLAGSEIALMGLAFALAAGLSPDTASDLSPTDAADFAVPGRTSASGRHNAHLLTSRAVSLVFVMSPTAGLLSALRAATVLAVAWR